MTATRVHHARDTRTQDTSAASASRQEEVAMVTRMITVLRIYLNNTIIDNMTPSS